MQHKIIEEVTKKEIDNQAQIAQKMVDLESSMKGWLHKENGIYNNLE